MWAVETRVAVAECAIGVAFYNAASVSVSRTNFLNSSFAAFSQVGQPSLFRNCCMLHGP